MCEHDDDYCIGDEYCEEAVLEYIEGCYTPERLVNALDIDISDLVVALLDEIRDELPTFVLEMMNR